MHLLSALIFVLLGLGLLAREGRRGFFSKTAAWVVVLLSGGTLLALNSRHMFASDVLGYFPTTPSIYEHFVFLLVASCVLLPPRGVVRRVYYIEFTTGIVFLLSVFYLIGVAFADTDITHYLIYTGTTTAVAVFNPILSLATFFLLQSRYESKKVLFKKLFTLTILFSGVLAAFAYASYVNHSMVKPDFNPAPYLQFIPLVIILLGVILSVLVILMIYAFSSLHERTVAYANEVTKGLRQAKAKDEAMLLSIGEGLVATGKDGNIVFVNRAFEEFLGWKEEEVQGKLFMNLVHMFDEFGKEIDRPNRPMHKVLNTKHDQGYSATSTSNMFYKRKDGSLFPVAVTISPIVVEDEVIGAVEVFRDITREKEIDKEKTEFVSLASHQLRTPLSSVNWYAEMLLAGDAGRLTKRQKEYAEEIFAGNQRMIGLVNSLLNVSRLELGTFSVNPEKVDIVALAFAAIDEQKLQIKRKKLKVTTEFPDERPCEVTADPKLLQMIFQNLLSNAIKYTPEKGQIQVVVEKHTEKILIKVTDSGIGIPKDQQDKIFTKLFRADNVKEQDMEGTGLGLYIIKSIVEASGGEIRFDSKQDKGTTFFVTLPASGMRRREGSRELT